MKKYLIIENSGSAHEEGAKSIAMILKNQGFMVDVLLSKRNFKRAVEININNYANNVQNFNSIFSLIYIAINNKKYSNIIFNTVSVRNTLFTFIASFFSNSNIYVVQNANSWLKYTWHKSSLIHIVNRNVSTYLKKRLILNATAIIVENNEIKNYFIKNNIENVETIPFILPKFERKYNQRFTNDQYNKIIFTVPGVVDFKKKNIETIINAFSKLNPDELIKVKLILLGGLKGRLEKEKCEDWEIKLGNSFAYYRRFIPTDQFNNIIFKSDFIISSFTESHKCEHLNEIYSESKGSGVDAHAISNSLPLIVNSSYYVDRKYQSSTVKFNNSAELLRLLREFIGDVKKINRLKLNAIENSKAYSLECICREVKYLW